jgi:hypothetical protein
LTIVTFDVIDIVNDCQTLYNKLLRANQEKDIQLKWYQSLCKEQSDSLNRMADALECVEEKLENLQLRFPTVEPIPTSTA